MHNSSETLVNFAFFTRILQVCTKTLQICYNVEHFLQDSDNIFAKNAVFGKKFLQKKCDVSFRPAATVAVYNAQTVPGSQQKGSNC